MQIEGEVKWNKNSKLSYWLIVNLVWIFTGITLHVNKTQLTFYDPALLLDMLINFTLLKMERRGNMSETCIPSEHFHDMFFTAHTHSSKQITTRMKYCSEINKSMSWEFQAVALLGVRFSLPLPELVRPIWTHFYKELDFVTCIFRVN